MSEEWPAARRGIALKHPAEPHATKPCRHSSAAVPGFDPAPEPHERDAFIAPRTLADIAGLPPVPAMEDYLRARDLSGTESLAAMATPYAKHFGSVVRHATVPEVVETLVTGA